jgi:hypothetical protein
MKIEFVFAIASFSIMFAACQSTKPPSPNQILKPTITNSIAASPSNSINAVPEVPTQDKTKIKTYEGKGIVTKINLELVSIELDHEEIKA